jgi:predicted nucleic acid-binding protein
MIVVADTAPLNYLILIGEIRLLPVLYGRVLIPPAVLGELSDPAAPDAVRRWIGQPSRWIEMRAPERIPVDFSADLGPGEREAIALSGETGAAALPIDDQDGRREAVRRKLAAVGTLGIIDLAGAHDLADLPLAISRLRATNFRASARLLQYVLNRDAARGKR